MKEVLAALAVLGVVLVGCFVAVGYLQQSKYNSCMAQFSDHKTCWVYAKSR